MDSNADTSDDEFRQNLREATKHTPRYLFRVWSSASGGDSRLNTEAAITPRAFLNGNGPSSIDDMSPKAIQQIRTEHYGGSSTNTVFSSWAPSPNFLPFLPGTVYTHASVIDTTLLSEKDPVFWTAAPELADYGLPSNTGEFLAFGVVDGHKSVKTLDLGAMDSLKTLTKPQAGSLAGPPAYTATNPQYAENMQHMLAATLDVGRRFGNEGGIGIAVACHLLQTLGLMYRAEETELIISTLANEDDVPRE